MDTQKIPRDQRLIEHIVEELRRRLFAKIVMAIKAVNYFRKKKTPLPVLDRVLGR